MNKKVNLFIFVIIIALIVGVIIFLNFNDKNEEKYLEYEVNLNVGDVHLIDEGRCINPTYEIDDENVLEIGNNRLIYAKVKGETKISLINEDGSICKVYNYFIVEKEKIIEDEIISVTDIIVSNEIVVKENEVVQLNYIVFPANYNEELLFSVSNTSIAIAATNGLIKGLKVGDTDLLITSSNSNFVKVIKIKVVENPKNINNNSSNSNIQNSNSSNSSTSNNGNEFVDESNSSGSFNDNVDNNSGVTNNGSSNSGSTGSNSGQSNNSSEVTLAESKIVKEYDNLVSFKTVGGKEVYPVIDLLITTNKTIKGEQSKIESLMRDLKNLGFTKVYFVVLPDGIPSIGWGLNKAVPDGVSSQYWDTAMSNTNNNINKAFADACHKYGMKAIAIYKPYENGGGTSYPSSKTTAYASFVKNKTSVDTIGGKRSYFSTLLAKNPEYRLKRKYNETEVKNSNLAINKVTMSFYYNNTNNANDDRISNIDLNVLNKNSDNKPTLWISTDNGQYFVYTDFTYTYTRQSSYSIKDVNGFSTNMSKPIITLTLNIKNLPQKYRYVAVSFSSNHYFQKNQTAINNGYANFPHSMIQLYNGSTKIPTSIAYYVRTVNNRSDTVSNHRWGDEGTPVPASYLKGIDVTSYSSDGTVKSLNYTYKNNKSNNYSQEFYKWGFEFQYKESNVSVTMGLNSPVYGIAAGKDEYVQGLVCEGYEEVRTYWLNEVKELLKYYDGIDIRTTTHSGNVPDYAYYGYNQPIADRYYEKYKVTLNSENVNYVVTRRISEIRGEFFLKFLQSASSYAKGKNKEFATDFYVSAYETYNYEDVTTYRLKEGMNQFYYWFNSKMILQYWKKAIDSVDYIIYKDIFSGLYDETVGIQFLNYAHNSKKDVLVHCYTTQGNNNCTKSFFDDVDKSKVDGVLVYEVVPWIQYDSLLTNLKDVVSITPNYQITSNTITGVKANTKVSDFVNNLNMAGTFVVLDTNGKYVSRNSYVKNNMILVLNDKYKFTIKVS